MDATNNISGSNFHVNMARRTSGEDSRTNSHDTAPPSKSTAPNNELHIGTMSIEQLKLHAFGMLNSRQLGLNISSPLTSRSVEFSTDISNCNGTRSPRKGSSDLAVETAVEIRPSPPGAAANNVCGVTSYGGKRNNDSRCVGDDYLQSFETSGDTRCPSPTAVGEESWRRSLAAIFAAASSNAKPGFSPTTNGAENPTVVSDRSTADSARTWKETVPVSKDAKSYVTEMERSRSPMTNGVIHLDKLDRHGSVSQTWKMEERVNEAMMNGERFNKTRNSPCEASSSSSHNCFDNFSTRRPESPVSSRSFVNDNGDVSLKHSGGGGHMENTGARHDDLVTVERLKSPVNEYNRSGNLLDGLQAQSTRDRETNYSQSMNGVRSHSGLKTYPRSTVSTKSSACEASVTAAERVSNSTSGSNFVGGRHAAAARSHSVTDEEYEQLRRKRTELISITNDDERTSSSTVRSASRNTHRRSAETGQVGFAAPSTASGEKLNRSRSEPTVQAPVTKFDDVRTSRMSSMTADLERSQSNLRKLRQLIAQVDAVTSNNISNVVDNEFFALPQKAESPVSPSSTSRMLTAQPSTDWCSRSPALKTQYSSVDFQQRGGDVRRISSPVSFYGKDSMLFNGANNSSYVTKRINDHSDFLSSPTESATKTHKTVTSDVEWKASTPRSSGFDSGSQLSRPNYAESTLSRQPYDQPFSWTQSLPRGAVDLSSEDRRSLLTAVSPSGDGVRHFHFTHRNNSDFMSASSGSKSCDLTGSTKAVGNDPPSKYSTDFSNTNSSQRTRDIDSAGTTGKSFYDSHKYENHVNSMTSTESNRMSGLHADSSLSSNRRIEPSPAEVKYSSSPLRHDVTRLGSRDASWKSGSESAASYRSVARSSTSSGKSNNPASTLTNQSTKSTPTKKPTRVTFSDEILAVDEKLARCRSSLDFTSTSSRDRDWAKFGEGSSSLWRSGSSTELFPRQCDLFSTTVHSNPHSATKSELFAGSNSGDTHATNVSKHDYLSASPRYDVSPLSAPSLRDDRVQSPRVEHSLVSTAAVQGRFDTFINVSRPVTNTSSSSNYFKSSFDDERSTSLSSGRYQLRDSTSALTTDHVTTASNLAPLTLSVTSPNSSVYATDLWCQPPSGVTSRNVDEFKASARSSQTPLLLSSQSYFTYKNQETNPIFPTGNDQLRLLEKYCNGDVIIPPVTGDVTVSPREASVHGCSSYTAVDTFSRPRHSPGVTTSGSDVTSGLWQLHASAVPNNNDVDFLVTRSGEIIRRPLPLGGAANKSCTSR